MGVATYVAKNGQGYSGASPSEKQAVLLPTDWAGDGSRRCVITAHGLLGDAWGITTGWKTGMFELTTLAAMGFPCINADLGGAATWGNDTAQTRVGEAFDYMVATHGCASDGFVAYGQSMGGPTMLNYMRAKPYNVVAFAGEAAGIGLKDLHDRSAAAPTDPVIGPMAGSIEAAYGGTAGYNSNINAHDPYTQMTAHSVLGIPMNFWVSEDDPIWPIDIAREFAAATGASLSSMGSIGHNILPLTMAVGVGKWMRRYVYRYN